MFGFCVSLCKYVMYPSALYTPSEHVTRALKEPDERAELLDAGQQHGRLN